jgi:hypothetical protein
VAPRPLRNLTSQDLLRRVRAEYLEMPGLRLTAQQAQCLFGLDAESCDAVLGTLRSDVSNGTAGSRFDMHTSKGNAAGCLRAAHPGRQGTQGVKAWVQSCA